MNIALLQDLDLQIAKLIVLLLCKKVANWQLLSETFGHIENVLCMNVFMHAHIINDNTLRKYTDTECSKTNSVSSMLQTADSIISISLCRSSQLITRNFCPSSTFNF